MTKDYKYILFDWDGCLADTLPIWLAGYKKVFAAYDVFPTDEEIAQKVFGDWEAEKQFGITDHEGFVEKLRAYVLQYLPTVGLHEGATVILAQLKKQNKKLAIVTSSKSENVIPALKYNDILQYFDAVITMDELTHEKPDPECIDKALKKLQGTKEQAIIIGDSIKDIGAGKNAGISTIAFYPKANRVLYTRDFIETFKADYIITDFKELEKLI